MQHHFRKSSVQRIGLPFSPSSNRGGLRLSSNASPRKRALSMQFIPHIAGVLAAMNADLLVDESKSSIYRAVIK